MFDQFLKLKPETVGDAVRALSDLFTKISKMDTDQVVAAYCTLQTCIEISGSKKNPVALQFEIALVSHMKYLCKSERDHTKKSALESRFHDLTGRYMF